MKRLFILFALFILASCSALSTTPATQEELVLSEVLNFEGQSKSEIYDKSILWIAETFNNSNAVIKVKDKEKGKILGKGVASCKPNSLISVKFQFTLKLDVKDGKARIMFDDWWTYNGAPLVKIDNKELAKPVKFELSKILESYQSYISLKEDNW